MNLYDFEPLIKGDNKLAFFKTDNGFRRHFGSNLKAVRILHVCIIKELYCLHHHVSLLFSAILKPVLM